MNILYIPIDERPCNLDVVKRIAKTNSDINLITPPKKLLGQKKTPANTQGLWDFILENIDNCQTLILSVDMLLYGGLIPSRLHYLEEKEIEKLFNRLIKLKTAHPYVKVYASNMIMRTPSYNSSDEEPDYYDDWGEAIFKRAYLQDKSQYEELSKDESDELETILEELPQKFIYDYERRRRFNNEVNFKMIELVENKVFDTLVFPQDDSSEFGYTAQDQGRVIQKLEQAQLFKEVLIYPGADEVGASLLARAYNEWKNEKPKVYTFWSSTLGPSLIPMYEDRPFNESLIAHIMATGSDLTNDSEKADIILAYNTPGKYMQEAWEQKESNLTYTSFRHLLHFTNGIKQYLNQNKRIIVVDSAYANGGDGQLIRLLDDAQVLDRITSYKGWNTNCNTLGTSLAQGVLASSTKDREVKINLLYHLLDDYYYQAVIRMEITQNYLPTLGLTYYDLKDKSKIINELKEKLVMKKYTEEIRYTFKDLCIRSLKMGAPWNRMFETSIHMEVKDQNEENLKG